MNDLISSVAAETDSRAVEYKQPEKAVLALELLAEGCGYKEVKARSGLGFTAITGLKGRHGGVLEHRRAELAKDAFELVEGTRLLVKRKMELLSACDESLNKVPLNTLAVSYGIFQDKGIQAVEGNKVVVEHKKVGPSLEDAVAAIEEAKRLVREEAIDVTPDAVQDQSMIHVMTEKELKEKVARDGWDADFVEEITPEDEL